MLKTQTICLCTFLFCALLFVHVRVTLPHPQHCKRTTKGVLSGIRQYYCCGPCFDVMSSSINQMNFLRSISKVDSYTLCLLCHVYLLLWLKQTRKSTAFALLLLQVHVHVSLLLLSEALEPRLAHSCRSVSQFLYHEVARSISTPPEQDASPSQVTSLQFVRFPQQFVGTHFYSWLERGTVRVLCLAKENNTVSPARARARTAPPRNKSTAH